MQPDIKKPTERRRTTERRTDPKNHQKKQRLANPGNISESRRQDRRLEVNSYDRRTNPRKKDEFGVTITITGDSKERFKAKVIDISPNGLKIDLKERLPLGENLLVHFTLPTFFTPIQIVGITEWRKPSKNDSFVHGISYSFNDFSDALNLNQYLDKKTNENNLLRKIDRLSWSVLRKFISLSELGEKSINGKADLGINFDHIYSNTPKGSAFWGKAIDWILLNLPAAKASRYRKENIRKILKREIVEQIATNSTIRILDIGCGTSRYTLEALQECEGRHKIEFIGVDSDLETIKHARKKNVFPGSRFVCTNIFRAKKLHSFSKKIGWTPTIIICSGLIYYLEDAQVKTLIQDAYNLLDQNGLFILSNLVNNPNKKLIGKLFITKSGDPWIPVSRRPQYVYEWLKKTGFKEIKIASDKWGMYSVFSSRKNKIKNKDFDTTNITTSKIEFRSNKVTYKAEFSKPKKMPLKSIMIFIHGLGYCGSAYKIKTEIVIDRGHGIFKFNLRGHAGTSGEWTLKKAIEDVQFAIKKIASENAGIPINIFSHSTGALIGVLASQATKGSINRLSLVNPVTSIFDSFMHWHDSGFNIDVRPYFEIDKKIPPIIQSYLDEKNVILDFKSGKRSEKELEISYRYGMLRGHSFKNLSNAIAYSPDLLSIAEKIDIPTIVFKGNYDQVIPVEKIETFFKKLNTREKIIIGTGSRDHFQESYWDYITDETLNFFENEKGFKKSSQ